MESSWASVGLFTIQTSNFTKGKKVLQKHCVLRYLTVCYIRQILGQVALCSLAECTLRAFAPEYSRVQTLINACQLS